MRAGSRGKRLAQAVPTIVFHGLADGTVRIDNGHAVVDQVLQQFSRLAQPLGICRERQGLGGLQEC